MSKLNIGIIIGSTREGRVSPQVANWVYEYASKKYDANFQIVDIKDFNLPFFGTSADLSGVQAWNQKLSELDAFVFVVSEYNHSISASLKNAIDSAKENWNNKAAGFVSYGSAYGARAVEHLRGILAEMQVATVRTTVLLSLFSDFENFSVFKPADLHYANLDGLLNQLIPWGNALKTIRK